MAAYCTQADVMVAAGRYSALTTQEATNCAAAVIQAQAMVDKMTGTFFDKRHLQVTTEAVQIRQRRLFLPAPVISIDGNAITENGGTLTLGADFLLYQPNTGPGWIEKTALGANTAVFSQSPSFWSNSQQAVVIAGQFGYAAVPADITKACAYIAAQILNWVTVTYETGDGVVKASLNLKLPGWVVATLNNRSISALDEQFFNFVTLT